MIASAFFANALLAARDAASSQDYPKAALYVVATPIGNLADISLRALHVLEKMDFIACEDTRHTQSLLRAYGLDRNQQHLLALHQHNEMQASQLVLTHLKEGKRIAYVSDAGTPAVSDPGSKLTRLAHENGFRVVPLPGASSVTAILSVAGLLETHHANGFVFVGFLPMRKIERENAVQTLMQEGRAAILLEAPHRIDDLADALAVLGERQITIGRELTKQFEEVCTLEASQFKKWLQMDAKRSKGEFVLLIHPLNESSQVVHEQAQSAETKRILQLLLGELPLKTAVRLCADITHQNKNALYEQALSLKNQKE